MPFNELPEHSRVSGAYLLDELAVCHPSTMLGMTLSVSEGHLLCRRAV